MYVIAVTGAVAVAVLIIITITRKIPYFDDSSAISADFKVPWYLVSVAVEDSNNSKAFSLSKPLSVSNCYVD